MEEEVEEEWVRKSEARCRVVSPHSHAASLQFPATSSTTAVLASTPNPASTSSRRWQSVSRGHFKRSPRRRRPWPQWAGRGAAHARVRPRSTSVASSSSTWRKRARPSAPARWTRCVRDGATLNFGGAARRAPTPLTADPNPALCGRAGDSALPLRGEARARVAARVQHHGSRARVARREGQGARLLRACGERGPEERHALEAHRSTSSVRVRAGGVGGLCREPRRRIPARRPVRLRLRLAASSASSRTPSPRSTAWSSWSRTT